MSERESQKNIDNRSVITHISDFLKFLLKAETIYAIADVTQNDADNETQDILHAMELDSEKNGKEEAT